MNLRRSTVRRFALGSIGALLTGCLAACGVQTHDSTSESGQAESSAATNPVASAAQPSAPSISPAQSHRALAAIARTPRMMASNPFHTFIPRAITVDADGAEHVKFDRKYRDLRVLGGDFVAHLRGEKLESVSETLNQEINLELDAVAIDPAAAGQRALAHVASQLQAVPAAPVGELLVYAREGAPVLAYEAIIEGENANGDPTELHVIVDARDGHTLDMWDGIETTAAVGTGRGIFNGQFSLNTNSTSSFELRDTTRGGSYTTNMNNRTSGNGSIFTDLDNTWGDGTLANPQTIAADAQFGTAQTWDYYLNVHQRTGIANNGVGAFNRVHYGRKYNNAFWSDSCFCMTYGDGDGTTFAPFDSIDIAGHEMSHGVMARTANLTYSKESGGLNEANSDIFGTAVEFYAEAAGNTADPGDYLIGEKIYKNTVGGTKALRYMWKPSRDGVSADCYYSAVGALDVHLSSGVANHFFYLLAEGTLGTVGSLGQASPTCNVADTKVATGTGQLTGIGRADAERIWYRAISVYMTSSTNYAGARTATLNAARDLFGAGSVQQLAVAGAWTAANVF